MATNDVAIKIPITLDKPIDEFIGNIRKSLGNVKNMGLNVDTSNIEEALDSYLDAYKKISSTKVNTGTFNKAQQELSKEIDNLKERTETLEKGLVSLVDVMSKTDGGRFANDLKELKQDMQGLANATGEAVAAIQHMTDIREDSTSLRETLTILKEIQNMKTSGKESGAFGSFKEARKELIALYKDITAKKNELANLEIITDDDKLRAAQLQKEITSMSLAWKEMYTANSNAFGDDFANIEKNSVKMASGTKKTLENLFDAVDEILGNIRENVDQNARYIRESLGLLDSINSVESDKNTLSVHAKLGTTVKGLTTQFSNLLDSVQSYLDSNPLEVGVTIATDWSTRRNKELLKQFQEKINNLSDGTEVSELRNLYNDIQKTFGNEINLKFKSNFDEEQKAIRAGVTSLKAEIGKKFELNPKFGKDTVTKLQAQLDKISQKMVLTIDQVKLSDGAIQAAATMEEESQEKVAIESGAISSVIDAMVEKSELLNKQLAPIWQLLVEIKDVLNQYPVDSIVDSTRELVRVIQQVFGVLSQEDLDNMFSGLQKRANAISGSLKLGVNQRELRSILESFREYQELGGKNTFADLGGNEYVQRWFKNNKDLILDTKDAVEELGKAEEKVIADASETASLENLSAKLDDVIKKIQEKTDEFRNEETIVSQVTASEVLALDNVLNKLTEIKGNLSKLFNTKQINNISSTLLSTLDKVTDKTKPVSEYLTDLEKISTALKDITGYSDSVKIISETSVATEDIVKITNAISELKSDIQSIRTALADGTIFRGISELAPEDAANIQSIVESLSELDKVLPSNNFGKNLDKVRKFVNSFSNNKGAERISKAAENIKKLREALDGEVSSNSLLLIFQKLSESTDISGLVKEIKNLLKVEAAANQAAVAKKEFSEANKKMKESADESSISIEKEKAALEKVWNKLNDLNQAKYMPGYVEQIAEIKLAMDGIDDTASEAAEAYKSLREQAERLWKEKGFPEWKKAAETSIASLQVKIEKFGANNTAISRKFRDELNKIRQALHDGMSIEEVQKLGAEFKKLEAKVNAAGQGGLGFFDTLRKRIVGVNAQLIAQYLSWQDIIRYVRQAVTTIRELDDALVDLKKTTTMSNSDLEKFYFNANSIAKEMGVTTEEIINQASSWSRLGYSTKEASEQMAQLSSQFASISPGMGVEEAQTGLVSIMKAWNVDVDRVERDIMDNINTLGNKFAETNSDIISGMERAGATLSAIGMDIDDSFALFTGAQEVIQNAETVGTALKTLSLRIRGYDEDTEELSDDVVAATGKVADLTKVASNGFAGISLWADAEQTQYRSLVDYLGDISKIWDEIDAKSQTQLLENLFGKRGASVGSAILKNFNQVEKALKEMEDAAGSADREMEIIRESISFKLNNLQQTWVGIIQGLIDRGDLGKLIDLLTQISEILGKIIEVGGIPGTILGTIGITTILPNLDNLDNIKEKFSDIFNFFKEAPADIDDTKDALDDVGKAAKRSSLSVGTLKTSLLAIAQNPITWIVVGLVAAKLAFDKVNVTVEETQEKIDDINSTIEQITSEVEQLNAIENRTDGQEKRLQYLQDELEIQKDLLEIAERRNLLEKSGSKFTDYFDKDNWNTKITGFENRNPHQMKSSEAFRKYQFEDVAEEYSKLQDDIAQLRANLENPRRSVNEHNKDLADAEKAKARLEELERQTYDNYYESMEDYYDLRKTAESIATALSEITEDNPLYDVLTDLSNRYDTQIKELETYIIQVDNLLGRESSVTTNSRFNEYNEKFENTLGYDELAKATSEFTQEQKLLWMTVTAGARNGKEAIDLWNKSLAEIDKASTALRRVAKELSFTQSISDLNDLESAINNVGNAIANIDENGKFQLGDLDSIADYFLALETAENKVEYETEAVSNALKLLGEGSGSVEEQANAINILADNYLRTSGILDGLTEKNKQLYITRLQDMGIINAETIVEEQLAQAVAQEADMKLINAEITEQLAILEDALQAEDSETVTQTMNVIEELLNEAEANDTTRRAVEYLIKTQEIFSNQDLSVNEKISQLEQLATSYMGTAEAAALASKIEALESQKGLIKGAGVTAEIKAQQVKAIDAQIQSLINKSASNVTSNSRVNFTRAQYNGGSNVRDRLGYTPDSTIGALTGATAKALEDSSKAASESAKEEFKEAYDYFERYIKLLDKQVSLLEAHLEDVVGSYAKNTLLSAEEDTIKKKMTGYASAIDMYSAKAREALSKIPSDVAQKLLNGAVEIEEFVGEGNEEVYNAIQEYEQWADKVDECKQQLVELKEALRQLELQKFNNLVQDFDELFDVRQTQIDLISKAISLFDTARDRIVGRGFYDVSIKQTEKQLSKLLEERTALTNQMTSALANGIDVASEEWFEMVKAIEEVNGKILDAQQAVEEYKNAIIQLYVDAFDRESNRYSKQIELRQKAISALEKQISVITSSGNLAGESLISEQIEQTKKQLDMLKSERSELVKRMSTATENGVKVASDEWYSMVDALNAVDSAIQDCEESINSLDDAILALHTETFERIQNRFASLSNELSNMAEMFTDKDVATSNNVWTKEGLAQLGLVAQQYELAKKQVTQYTTEISELNAQYARGKYSTTEYIEKLAELKEAQWSAVKAAESAKESIVDINKQRVEIVVDAINKEIEAFKKLTEAQKENLQAEKDLHDYQKQIADSSKNIVDLERQLAAMADDNSAATIAKRKKLEEQLAEARQELAEEEYQHSISAQQEALDQQAEDYSEARNIDIETLQETLENEELIITESFEKIKENTALIGSEILTMAQLLGVSMSEELTAPWQSGENAIASYGELLTVQSSAFIQQLSDVENSEWRLQEQANLSSQAISDMFGNRADELVQQTDIANEATRREEAAAWDASRAIADAFGNRADGLVQTIENARGSTENLTRMSDALSGSLKNSIDGQYSGASAQSALNGIAEAANGVAEAANNAANALSRMASAQPVSVPTYTGKIYQQGSDGDYYYAGTGTVSGNNIYEKNGKIYVDNGYASGARTITQNQLAWTQEDGPEMIVSPSTGAILTPLRNGDSVIPTSQTSNIWEWSRFDPTEFANKLIQSMPEGVGKVQNNTMQVGSLVTVNGNVNDSLEMTKIAAQTASVKIKESFTELSNGLNK
jgi:TP901 family phage tail tape measure protein